MARPRKEINWEMVEKLLEAKCSVQEISAMFRMNIETFYDNYKREYGHGFAEKPMDYKKAGDATIRLTQYLQAVKGNTRMLERLGDIWLDQTVADNRSTAPNQQNIDIINENMRLKHENVLLKTQLEVTENGDKPETGPEPM